MFMIGYFCSRGITITVPRYLVSCIEAGAAEIFQLSPDYDTPDPNTELLDDLEIPLDANDEVILKSELPDYIQAWRKRYAKVSTQSCIDFLFFYELGLSLGFPCSTQARCHLQTFRRSLMRFGFHTGWLQLVSPGMKKPSRRLRRK